MAKKKKVQDTSPLAMGRQQKGSAANKRVQKAGTNTKSQSSVSQKDRINQKNYGTTTPNVRRTTAPTSRSTASNNRAEQRQIQPTARKTTNAPTAASMNRQRQQQQNRPPATAAEMRRQNADRNMNLKQTKAATAREMTAQRKLEAEKAKQQNTAEWNTVKNKSKEEQQKWFTQKAQEAQKRNTGKVEKGTDNLATSAAKAAFHSGKGAVHSLFGAATRASIEDEYDTQKDKALASIRGEDVNKAEKAAREKAQQRKELKLAGIREKTRIEQEKAQEIQDAEAAKDKGPIPLRKMAVGAASFTGQRLVDSAFGPYSLASMGARVIEDERNSAKEKNDKLKQKLAESGQFTQEELDNEFKRMDRRSVANAYASAGIEVLSELMFGGIGLSKKYIPEGASGFLDKAAGKLLGKVGSTAAGKLALGIGEETLEEWIANPIQAAVSNRLTGNKLQSLQEESVRREYQKQAMDLREIKATSADINSQAFLERAKEIYKESGASDEEATKIAELARDYFNADITGDNKTAEAKLKEITGILAGGENDLREKWTLRDALEVAGEMIMSVGAEATPGAITSSMAGNDYKANYGIEGVRKLAKVVENLDTDKSDRAKAIIDDIDKGKDLTGTQVSEIMQWSSQAAQKAQEREASRDDLVRNRMKAEKLSVPIVDAEYNLAPATEERFEQIVDRVADTIQDDMKLGMSDVDAYAIGDVVAAFETGTISAEQMNELNIENPEARAVFEKETGINLDEYTVKDKKGNIKVAASNTDMQEALFSKAADNYIESAKIEQEYWNDTARGEMEEELTSNVAGADFKGRGRAAVLAALRTADPQDRGQFMLTGSAARRVYEAGRFSNDSWDDVKGDFKSMFNEVDEATLRNVFEAAKEDKAIEETDGYGKRVKAGDKISRKSLNSGEQVVVPGSFDNKSKRKLGEAEKAVLIDIANEFNLQIEMSDDPKVIKNSENGIYDPNNNKIILNAANTMEENLTFALSHEVTHHLAVTAPEQYLKLSNYLMDKAYKSDSEGFTSRLQSIQDQYYEHTKDMDKPQKLTPEQAFEEIIANNAHEFWTDEGFAEDVCREEPSLAEAIIDAIKNVLTKIRNILSSGNVTNDAYRDTLFGEVEVYDEAYKLYKRTYQAAKKTRADVTIDQKQDEMNTQSDSSERLSLSDSDMTIQGNTARWTDHRIGSLIREYGSDIDDKYSHAWAVTMSPRDFLKLTIDDGTLEKWMQDENETRPLDEEKLRGESQTPFLIIDDTGTVDPATDFSHRVTGHEGRHRMIALMNAGVESVPVAIRGTEATKYKKTSIRDLTLAAQSFYGEGGVNNEARIDVSDLVPIKESNRDELIEKFGGEADVRFSISEQQDADYMKAVESGDMETAQRMVDEAAAKAMPNTATPGRWLHGTENDFTVFDFSQGGKNGAAEGFGIYLARDKDVSEHYGKRLIEGYVNIEHPATDTERTISKSDLVKLISATVDQEAERLAEDYDGDVEAAKKDTWISNYTYTYDKSLDASIREVADNILSMNEYDREIVQEVMAGMAIRDYSEAEKFYDILTDLTGIDGFTTTWENIALEGTRDIALAFRSSQIKDSSPVTYDDDGNVIPLSQRFDMLNPDIRYSLGTESDIMHTLEESFDEYKEDKANLRIATEAIADLRGVSVTGENLSGQRWSLDETASQRRMDNRADSGISSARTIAKGITSSLVNEGYIDFIGQKVESPEDLAKLGQVLRDPRFETFRLVLTKGNKIVSFQSCSARMPGLSPVHNEASDAVFYEKIKEQMDKLGADGYYLMHNHPSGDVTASEDDRRVTANAIFKLGSEAFKGHVILDHDKFGLISNVDVLSAPGSVSLTNMEAPIYGQQTIDLIHEPEIDHPLLGEKAKNGEIVASIGEKVNTSNDYSVIIYVSSKLEVRGIQEVSNKEIEKDLGKFKSFIREQGVEFGSVSALLYSPSGSDVSFSTIENLFGEGVILDAVYGDTHFFDLGLARNGDPSTMGRSKDEINSRITVYESVAGTQDYNSIRYSITPKMDADYMNAVNSNNMEEAQELVNEAAKMAGYGLHVYHGTLSEPFTRFKRPAENWSSHGGGRPGFIYASVDEDYAAIYSFVGEPFSSDYEEGFVMEGYMNIDNMIDVGDVDGLIFKNNGWDHPDYENDPESLFSKDATKEFKNLCKVMDMTPYELVHALGEELYYDSENIYQLVNSPEFAQLIKDKGYDGIKLLESGSDAYGVLEPTQIKSADTVTYAEDGSIIPLSERFNPENDDIRYSLPTQSSQGNILSDGQMEYFKNSQARDEQGRLVPVFHTTNKGGFTVFDPSFSDDRRSLFFASNFAVSQTYGHGYGTNLKYTDNTEPTHIADYKSFEEFERDLMQDLKNRGKQFSPYEPHAKLLGVQVRNKDGSIAKELGKNAEDRMRAWLEMTKNKPNRIQDYTISMFDNWWMPETNKTGGILADNLDGLLRQLSEKMTYAEGVVGYDSKQGYYECYLNLENPLIVDAKGANWNAIPYGEEGNLDNHLIELENKSNIMISSIMVTQEDFNDDNIPTRMDISIRYEKKFDGKWHPAPIYFEESVTISPEEFDEFTADPTYLPWKKTEDILLKFGLPRGYIEELESDHIDYDGDIFRDFKTDDQVQFDYINTETGEYEIVDPYAFDSQETYRTRELAAMAEEAGYDGVIIKNCRDIGAASPLKGLAESDIYIAFSSNQVKDAANLNPTENPDIRYSIVNEDDAKSKMAYDEAMDNSYEALEYYEQRIADLTYEAAENRPVKKFSEEKIEEFYAGLRSTDSWVHTDPTAEEDAVRMANSKKDFFANLNAKWNDRWTTGGEVLNVKSVKTDVRNLVMGVMQNSDTDSKYRNDLVKKTLFDVRTAFQLMKQDRPEVASALLYHSAQRMIDNVQFYVDGTFDQYKDLKHYLRTTKISLGEEYWSDVDYDAFRKRNYNRINLVKGKTNVDQVYQELEEMFPEFFNGEETMSVPDQLLQMEEVLDTVQPYTEAYSSEAAAELAFDIADDLYEIMVNGDEVRSLADRYKDRYDAKTRAMKQRHAEAMLRVRKARDEGIKKEKARFTEYKEKQKEKKLHSKHFDSINKNYKWLRERLLTNTKDKHIPEQYKKDLAGLLAAFDLQTVGSKKLEAKRGYQSQKTIQMSAIRSGLDAMHKAYETFFVHDAITDKIDALASQVDGKTIDELSVDQLSEIDDILKGLKSDFINYDKIMVKGKQRAAADVGKAQTQGALKHAEQFGAGKDYQNLPGVIDKLINLDEMTAPYMFRKIDPNNEGLGMMYGEIRRGFDKYVRNQNQLNDWMDEIVGKYHQKGILWNKYGSGELSDWRSDTHAVTFNFEHGPVRLTPAQMMSIYCLAKRPQAYQHMISEYGGIVAAPVTFNAKILSDIKKSVNTALSVPLTDADIKQIVAELTPDQIQVAEKLQELMATKMADWGNEASMDVMGIELFKEREYFPIKSDSAVLQKDLNDSEFVQAIRNFGFTKALTPNANNAIVVEDIFDVVTEHCNNMNLYNAYSKAFDDFMKVYNYKDFGEGGTGYTVQQAVAHAYSKKATTFIMTFLRDLNGNVSGRASGIEDAYNSLLGNAKKAAVFANLRVAAQQPTAITRAFYVIDPKYMKGIKIEKGAMTEMFEHCPIALWKSWGYYDINMGKSIEDIMMNNGRWLEDKATDLYGALDNVTWTAIWQMVKNEMKDTHPDVKEGTDEYWDLCNERMSEVVDLTQVVDSPLHRSHAMRDKGFLKKTATSFMAEPTLTFNMLRDGCERSAEARRMGKILLAGQIASRTIAVALFQAVTVAGAAGLVDALRKKNPDKDDEDDSFLHLWWVNALENFKDELKVWNKIYFIKDIASLMEGWDNANLALQGIQKFSLGWRQLQGDPYARSSAGWYENMADGLGYMFGVPVKTMRTGIKNVMEALGITSPVIDATKESLDAIADNNKKKQKEEKGTMVGKLTSDEFKIEGKGLFGKLLKKADEKESGTSESEAEGSNSYEEERDRLRDLEAKAKEKTQGLTGKELDDALWDVLSDGYTKELDAGNLDYIEHLELIYMNAGGDTELFRAKIKEKIGSSYKKTFADNMSQEDLYAQDRMRHYMEELLDFSEDEVSAICYKTDKARDLKVAFRLNNEQYINDEMSVLVRAGLTQADLEKLYKNRNRMNLKTYNGKYKDQLKSTGKYVFPVDGIITSDFGHRASPGGIGSTNHQGIDIGAKSGTPVGAADGGTVVMAGWYGGYGKTVQVKHDDGTITQYSHLSWWDVNVGDTVGQGQEIGLVGSTGNSTGPHLHLGVIKEGKYVDPKQYFNTRDKSWAADA